MSVAQDIYPSRVSAEPKVIRRQDPTVYTDRQPDEKFLTLSEKLQYEERGFLVKDALFSSDEIDKIRRHLKLLVSSDEIKNREESVTELESGEVRSIFAIHQLSEVFDHLSRDPRILNVVQHLLDDDLYIHQSRVNMKPGFVGKEFDWHSDFETWHVEDGMPRMRAISVSIALTPNYPFNGALMLIPGSHTQFIGCVGSTPEDNYKSSLRKQETGVPDKDNLTWMADQAGIDMALGAAGSVLFFECNVMHGSNSNITPFPRSNAFFVYNAISNKLARPYGGCSPRPEFVASRENIQVLNPIIN